MILAITQARIGSSRLPGKILKKIGNKTLLEIHLERILQSKLISKIKVATTIEPETNEIDKICEKLGIGVFKGSVEDVLERFYYTALPEKPDYVVRLTSDCPLIDPDEIDNIIKCICEKDYDYVSNALEPSLPDGMDAEVFKFSALEKAFNEATLKSDREHVTPFIWRNSTAKGGHLFKSLAYKGETDFSQYRLTVDEMEDFNVIEILIKELGIEKGWREYIRFLINNPDILKLNSKYSRNEGYQKSLKMDTEK